MKSNLFDTDLEAIEILQTLFSRCTLPELKAILDAVNRGTVKAWVADQQQKEEVSINQNINI